MFCVTIGKVIPIHFYILIDYNSKPECTIPLHSNTFPICVLSILILILIIYVINSSSNLINVSLWNLNEVTFNGLVKITDHILCRMIHYHHASIFYFVSHIKVSYVNALCSFCTRSFTIYSKGNATSVVLLKHRWFRAQLFDGQINQLVFNLLLDKQLHPH